MFWTNTNSTGWNFESGLFENNFVSVFVSIKIIFFTSVIVLIFRRVRKIAKSDYELRHASLSVRLSACIE